MKFPEEAITAATRAIYGPSFDHDRKSDNWNVSRDVGQARAQALAALEAAMPYLREEA